MAFCMFSDRFLMQVTAGEYAKMRADVKKIIRVFGLTNLRVQASSEIPGSVEQDGTDAIWYDAGPLPPVGNYDGVFSRPVPVDHYDHIRKLDAWHIGYLMALGFNEDGNRHACEGCGFPKSYPACCWGH